MDFSTTDWISEFEMEMDDASFIREWQMNSLDASVFNVNRFSPSNYTTDPTSSAESAPNHKASETDIYIPKQPPKNNDINYSTKNYTCGQKSSTQRAYSSPYVIAFGDASAFTTQNPFGKQNSKVKTEADAVSVGEMSFPARSTLQAQYHVLAERKRREKLSELFVSLSNKIPGLKKLDKASILKGTIDYLEKLEERIRTFEQAEQKKKKHDESVVSVHAKRNQLSSCDDTSSSDENFDCSFDRSLPAIEVRSCNGNVVLKFCCKKRTGIIAEILCQVEKLELCIINISAAPYDDSTLHVNVIAQMNGEFCLSDEDLEEYVREAILKLI